MKLGPLAKKILRFGAIGCGALAVVSAVVNIAGAFSLIDAAEEQSLGLTRNEIVVPYAVMGAIGIVLIWLGLRRWKSR
ncbi:MAG TPA: hypothetical protein VHD62_07450 [Opitutaceae bacterium]|nr:hypothetical protein [Opitutaceae bacterium]